jgi:cell wall-associated NlpC family hydrolase
MTGVERLKRQSTRLPTIKTQDRQFIASVLVIVTFSAATLVVSSSAGASSIGTAREQAAVLYQQIQSIGSRVETLGQKYDLARINLQQFQNQIKNSKEVVAQIERSVAKGNAQLRRDVIFAYVTNSALANVIPLFSRDRLKADATNVYSQIAGGNVSATLASLKYHKIKLTRERAILYKQDRRANSAAHDAAKSFHDANVLRASLEHTLSQVKGKIATFVAQQVAAAAAASAAALQSAKPTQGIVAPPPNSRANIAIRAAMSMIGVPYVWGGASRSGVDCSGLILLAYAAAGVILTHYSGSQYADTQRVPLWNIQPGDLLFYGPNGSEHEAMYIGNGQMIEAASSGTLVHISPIRLGYGFVGLGRIRT